MNDDILTTKGVRSYVYDENGDVIGHILLLDYDGSHTDMQVEREINELPGITALLESSPNSYHAWNLTVRSMENTALKAMRTHCDPKHVQIGFRSGRWVLRIGSKESRSGNEYKSPPELLRVIYNHPDNPEAAPQSTGHFNLLRAMYGVDDIPVPLEWVGDSYSVEHYRTITDELKEDW